MDEWTRGTPGVDAPTYPKDAVGVTLGICLHGFRVKGQPYEGLAYMKDGESRWTGKLMRVEHMMDKPLRWKKAETHLC